jgi:Arc/MetJ-type ribon-helix-helix transcriptional regulator
MLKLLTIKCMNTIHISLPGRLSTYVQKRVKERHYADSSQYIEELIRIDQLRETHEDLERLLTQGEESGILPPMAGKDWDTMRRNVEARFIKEHGGV